MEKIKAILVDDEKHSNETLRIELSRHCPEVEVIKDFTNSPLALDEIPHLEFELLFLDIDMPFLNGFELLRQLKNINFHVIFITAYDNYAIDAFKVSAVDYLLKPVQGKDLTKAVEKVHNRNQPMTEESLSLLIHNLDRKNTHKRIVLPTSEGLEIVDSKDIIRCKADNNYSHVYLKNERHIFLSKSLKTMQKLLPDSHFIRVHQSHLVNSDCIKKYIKKDGGYLIMENNTEVPVSNSKRDNLLERLYNL